MGAETNSHAHARTREGGGERRTFRRHRVRVRATGGRHA